MAFEITKKEVAETVRFQLVDPETDVKIFDDEGKAVEIELYSKASKQYRDALSKQNRKNLQRKNKSATFEENMEDSNEILAAISKKAHNLTQDGEPVDNFFAFKKLYANSALYWIRDQVQEAFDSSFSFVQK